MWRSKMKCQNTSPVTWYNHQVLVKKYRTMTKNASVDRFYYILCTRLQLYWWLSDSSPYLWSYLVSWIFMQNIHCAKVKTFLYYTNYIMWVLYVQLLHFGLVLYLLCHVSYIIVLTVLQQVRIHERNTFGIELYKMRTLTKFITKGKPTNHLICCGVWNDGTNVNTLPFENPNLLWQDPCGWKLIYD